MEKLNIAELLKNCPTGMELDCTMFENVKFDYIKEDSITPIRCFIENEESPVSFNEYGEFNIHPNAKCVIFPKGKTTWEGFQRPFKDGDVVICVENNEDGKEEATQIFILKSQTNENRGFCYTGYDFKRDKFFGARDWSIERLATEKEKQKLFDAIKANGYKWNPKTKTLEELIEPKFKVGDRVKQMSAHTVGIVVKVDDKGYYIDYPKGNGVRYISFTLEKDYELLPNKFDINTLKPFDSRVLVRNFGVWKPAFWGYYSEVYAYPFVVAGGNVYAQCIPYEENKHLLGTNDDCDEYYKTWK